MSITLQKTFPISTFPYLNNTETLPLDVQCNFFLLSLYLLQSTLFLQVLLHLWVLLVLCSTFPDLHLWWDFCILWKTEFQFFFFMYIKSDWQSLTCFQHWKKMNISFRILDIHKRTFLTARFSGIISFRFIQ